MSFKLLIVDDDENLLKSLQKILKLKNYSVDTVANPVQVEKLLENNHYHSILLDVRMPGINGLDLLKMVMHKSITTPVIMISGQSNIEIAVQAIKEGAYDFIEKPIDPDRLFVTLKNALQKHELLQVKETIYQELASNFRMIGESAALRKIFNIIQKIANTNTKVLITGESGTGKELVAWAIHHNSHRQGKPYIKINCAAIPYDLLESELFGHRKGSFTGAIADHKGKFLEADGGTLFLDEIGEMDLHLQAKLLRVLEENEVEIIGDNLPRKVDVRVIAATNQDVNQLIKKGRFREDLFHRLNVIRIHIPPLRERIEDVLPLSYYFLKMFCESYNRQILNIHRQVEAFLMHYHWPGNVRELKNIIEKLVIFTEGNEIRIQDVEKVFEMDQVVSFGISTLSNEKILDLKTAHEQFEKRYILQTLQKLNWKKGAAAKALGIDRSNLFKKMKKLGII
ncbi:MAG: sigma-54-dependent transcriptional regulator [Candidatus Helarchaeota archaeon]